MDIPSSSPPEARAGLLIVARDDARATAAEPIPLTSVRADVEIAGASARVRLTQTYTNRESVPVEAVYIFPLDESSAVCGFTVTTDGRRLEGRVLPRDEAFETYDDALADGHGAYLLDQERPNVFTASAGNLLPGQTVDVELRYVTTLHREGDALRFVLPGYVAPRYVPESMRDFEGLEDAERITPPPLHGPSPYRLEVEVVADLHAPLGRVESPSHALRTEVDGARARIRLAGPAPELDRDFVLLLEPREAARPLAGHVRTQDGEAFAAVTFLPRFETERQPVHVEFVVDCSESMTGRSIEEVRRTLRLCLRSLRPGDRFNIIRFGSEHVALFPEARVYDEDTFRIADAYAAAMEADLGGTEIAGAIRAALAPSDTAGGVRRVLVLTDGEVINERQVLNLAREHRAVARFFVFGIGDGASEYLVRGLARAGGGAAEMVYPGESIEAKVARQFHRLAQPLFESVSVAWEGIEVEDVTPAEIVCLVPGEPLTVMARVVSGDRGRAVLTARLDGREVRIEAEVPAPDGDPEAFAGGVLPWVWARSRLRDLEEARLCRSPDDPFALGARREGSQQHARGAEWVRNAVRELACRYGLLSSETSFVVVEERGEERRVIKRPELRRVPVYEPAPMQNVLQPLAGQLSPKELDEWRSSLMQCPDFSLRRANQKPFESLIKNMKASELVVRRLHAGWKYDGDPGPGLEVVELEGTPPSMVAQYSQNYDGSWELEVEVALMADASLEDLKREAAAAARDEAERILATWVVLVALEEGKAMISHRWQAIEAKAHEWLDQVTRTVPPPDGYEDWETWARAVLDRCRVEVAS